MKKTALLLGIAMVFAMMAGCAGGGETRRGSAAGYAQVIRDARTPEMNDVALYDIVTGPGDKQYDMYFDPSFGFVEADMEKYAVSLGTIITIAYGIAIILPAEGREQAVLDQANGYVEQQRKAQENYLPNQYEIAKAAIVKTVDTGEVVMVMTEEAETVMAKIEAALKAG
jgi:hypothetical protein